MRNPTSRARALRRNLTDAERTFWHAVRNRRLNGHKFRRQVWLGAFIADFACIERRLIVEIDGGQHALRTRLDKERSAHLAELGFHVVRYWNNDVLNNLEGVLGNLIEKLELPSP